jgi:hypothetical protein
MKRVALLLTLLACLPATAQPRRDQEVDEKRLQDHGHGFGLFRLDPRWRLVEEEALSEGNRNAVAGLVHPAYGAALLVLTRPEGDLAQVASLSLSELPLLAPRVDKRTTLEVEGRPALRVEGAGRLPDGSARRFGLTLIALPKRVIELQAVASQASEITPLWGAFHLLKGPAPGRARPTRRRVGNGWRLVGPVFETLAGGLRIEAGEGWRLRNPDQLQAVGGTEARLEHLGRFVTLDLTVVRVGDAKQSELLSAFRTMVQSTRRDKEELAWSTIPVAGAQAQVVVSNDPQRSLVAARGHVLTTSPRGRLLIGVFARWDRSLGAQGPALLRQGLAGVRILSQPDFQTLATFLRANGRRAHGVSLDQRLRAGVLSDYALDLRWKLPPGLWRARLAAPRPDPLLRCALRDPATGLQAHLRYVQPLENESPAELHERLRKGIEGARVLGPAHQARGLRLSWLERSERGIPERVLLASTRRGKHGLALVAWGARGDVAPVQSALAEQLTQLEFSEPGLRDHDLSKGVLTHHRLGFRLRPPPEFSARVVPAGPTLQAHGGRAELRHPQRAGWLGVVARAPGPLSEARLRYQDAAWFRQLHARVGGLRPGDLKTLAGRPCEHLWGKGPGGDRCDVFLVAGPIRYVVLMTDRAGRHPKDGPLLKALEFLE